MNKDKIVEIINQSDVLNKIADKRVFGFKDHHESEIELEYLFDEKGRIVMVENCDSYHCVSLDKDEVMELSKVFKEIAEQM